MASIPEAVVMAVVGRRRASAASVGRAVALLGLLGVVALAVGPAFAHTNLVEVDAQRSVDGTILVEGEFAATEAWLVVRLDDEGEPGRPIAHRRAHTDGYRADTTISIPGETWRGFEGPRRVWVVLHREGGGAGFDPATDPLLRSFGEPAGSRVPVAPAPEPARVTALAFGAQSVEDGTVTIRRATLPTRGFLAIHAVDADVTAEATDADRGRVVGVTDLAAGRHDDVTVQLAADAFAGDVSSEHLQAVLYRGDGPFTANDTQPITVAGDAVGTTFGVEDATVPPATPETTTTHGPHPTATTGTAGGPTATSDGAGAGLGLAVALVVGLLALLARIGRR